MVDREDQDRLPAGFTRTGYDADEQKYYYTDADGRTWVGAEGQRYGTLRPVGHSSPPAAAVPDEIVARDDNLKRLQNESIRAMLPFALLVLVVLFLVFRFVDSSSKDIGKGNDADGKIQVHCAQGYAPLQINKGDTCWGVAEGCGLGVDELLGLEGNERVECERLRVGQEICVPV
ncbi:carbohydrate-binding module family 50 protein [Amniculicola lignicola CBS 123094]|uniref:Carbohydrate-binding module family 50 protein n=1 Tax=Amniculicola lignicola CBS 123094 TaxID=1392246 RepID=A0A6A5WLC6_9PLEO|nr:carbohydrate-binding module family 50 protein [Amniculicola lignicola CBS 123094]